MLDKIIASIKKYSGHTGRVTAAAYFGKQFDETAAEEQGEGYMARIEASPLGAQLGYMQVEINEKAVMDTAVRAYKKSPDFKRIKAGMNLPEDADLKVQTPPWPYIREPLMAAYQAGAVKQGMSKQQALALTEDDCFGKGHIGWIKLPESTPLDLAGKNWRWSDWTRPKTTTLGERVALSSLNHTGNSMAKDLGAKLGDGCVGVLRPEVLGLPTDKFGYYQVRVTLHAPESDTIVAVYKGLVVVHPKADNSWAYPDGYGHDVLCSPVYGIGENGEGAELQFHEMLDGEQFMPKCRYTIQGGAYQGIPEYLRAFLGLENIKMVASGSDVLVEDRMLRANVPVKALGGWGLMTAMQRLLKLTVFSGHARIVLPSEVFQHIEGQSQVHAKLVKTYTSKVTGKQVSGFYAPKSLRPYFERAGGVGSEWVLNRRPDLPTGACVHRHTLLGYVEFNAFVINGDSMKLSGLDFDGDMVCVFPPVERGGLYIAFNDLDESEQQRRLDIAGGDRKSREKKDFLNGLCRHAGQLASAGILGPADITARKFMDVGKPEQAWAMEPWIQASVDLQKRDMALPHPDGVLMMPQVMLAPNEITMTQVLRALQKGEPAGWREMTPADKATFANMWEYFEFKLEQLFYMSRLCHPASGIKFLAPTTQDKQVISRFGYELGSRMAKAIGELDTYNKTGKPIMRKFDYADRQALPISSAPEAIKKMASTVSLIDAYLPDIKEACGIPAIRQGFYNLKDGLLDAARDRGVMGELAQYASKYEVFQMFADEQAFKDYFQHDTGKRLSDFFCVLDSSAFSRVQDAGKLPMYRNTQKVIVGLHEYHPGDITVTEHGMCDMVVVARNPELRKQFIVIDTAASTISDALLSLRIHMANKLLEEGRMLSVHQIAMNGAIVSAEEDLHKEEQPEQVSGNPEAAFLAGIGAKGAKGEKAAAPSCTAQAHATQPGTAQPEDAFLVSISKKDSMKKEIVKAERAAWSGQVKAVQHAADLGKLEADMLAVFAK